MTEARNTEFVGLLLSIIAAQSNLFAEQKMEASQLEPNRIQELLEATSSPLASRRIYKDILYLGDKIYHFS
jgi:hypothetical protein